MLRESSVCMFTVPHSIGASDSVDSGTTDDTGIGSSCPLPSPTLPIGHSDHDSTGDNPPPIPPKSSRRIPPIPPRNGSHSANTVNTCPIPRFNDRLPVEFKPPTSNVLFSGNLLVNSPCPCGRVEPWGSEGRRCPPRIPCSIQESRRSAVFHPTYEAKLTDATKSGCGNLQRICSTLSRWLRLSSLREPSQRNSPINKSTPTISPRHLVRNLDRNTVRGFLSAHATTSIQEACSIKTPSSIDVIRRKTNHATNPSAYIVDNDNPFAVTRIRPPKRQRPNSRSSFIAATLRSRKQQQQQCAADSSSSSTTPSMYTISPSRHLSSTIVYRDTNNINPNITSGNSPVATAVDPLRQAASTSASATCPSTLQQHRRCSSQATPVADRAAVQQPSAPPLPVLLHHVHIHHVHHYHHGPDSGAVGLTLAKTTTDGRISTTSTSSSGSSGGVDHRPPTTSGWCCNGSNHLCTLPAGSARAAGGCCCCYSPDLAVGGGAVNSAGITSVVEQEKPSAGSDVFAQTSTLGDHCQPCIRPELTTTLPSRCCSSASATLASSRGSPGSCCYSSCCCCCCCCCSTSAATPTSNGTPAQRHTVQQPPPHRHHTHHHHTQHHHHLQRPHRQSSVAGQSRAPTRGSSATMCCCCTPSAGPCRLSTTTFTPTCQTNLLNSEVARAGASGTPHRGSRCSPSVVGQSMCPALSPVLSTVPVDDSAVAVVSTTATLTAELQDRRSSFQRSMQELRKMGWYWGPISFLDAQLLLAKRPDGTFLVRDSGHDTYILSLSFRVRGETYHTRIEHNQGRFSFWSQPQTHSASTMVEFIEKAVAHSISGQFHYFLQSSAPGQPPVEVPLLYPLSRFQVVPSLRHLSRFTILSYIRRDHIDRLPLPRGLLQYLSEKQCYAESLEAYEAAIRDRSPLPFQPRQVLNQANGPGADESVVRAETLALPRSLASPPQPHRQRDTE